MHIYFHSFSALHYFFYKLQMCGQQFNNKKQSWLNDVTFFKFTKCIQIQTNVTTLMLGLRHDHTVTTSKSRVVPRLEHTVKY